MESWEERKQKDQQKIDLCKSQGITLIPIPYWWDRKFESLQATIYNERPDLFKQKPSSKAIPDIPPSPKPKSPEGFFTLFSLLTLPRIHQETAHVSHRMGFQYNATKWLDYD